MPYQSGLRVFIIFFCRGSWHTGWEHTQCRCSSFKVPQWARAPRCRVSSAPQQAVFGIALQDVSTVPWQLLHLCAEGHWVLHSSSGVGDSSCLVEVPAPKSLICFSDKDKYPSLSCRIACNWKTWEDIIKSCLLHVGAGKISPYHMITDACLKKHTLRSCGFHLLF